MFEVVYELHVVVEKLPDGRYDVLIKEKEDGIRSRFTAIEEFDTLDELIDNIKQNL